MQSVDDLIQKEMAKRSAVVSATRKAGVGVVTDKDAEALRKAADDFRKAADRMKPKQKLKTQPKPKPGGKTSSYRRGSVRVDTYES